MKIQVLQANIQLTQHRYNLCKQLYRFDVEQPVQPGQDDEYDGGDVDGAHEEDHECLADGLLETGHATLARQARLEQGDGQQDREENHLEV